MLTNEQMDERTGQRTLSGWDCIKSFSILLFILKEISVQISGFLTVLHNVANTGMLNRNMISVLSDKLTLNCYAAHH